MFSQGSAQRTLLSVCPQEALAGRGKEGGGLIGVDEARTMGSSQISCLFNEPELWDPATV